MMIFYEMISLDLEIEFYINQTDKFFFTFPKSDFLRKEIISENEVLA